MSFKKGDDVVDLKSLRNKKRKTKLRHEPFGHPEKDFCNFPQSHPAYLFTLSRVPKLRGFYFEFISPLPHKQKDSSPARVVFFSFFLIISTFVPVNSKLSSELFPVRLRGD